jgi:hypothetical protein
LLTGAAGRIKKDWLRSRKYAANTTNGRAMLNQDFKEFIKSLNDNQVKYLVVGGYAVAFHGHPRYTKDLDIWIEPEEINANHLVAALDQFGFGSLGLTAHDFLDTEQIIQLGLPPNRIDLILKLSGLEFYDAYQKRVETQLVDMIVNFIDVESLIVNKKASGRLQDLADVESLSED